MRSEAKRVLYINLTTRASEIKVHSDLSDGLGGVGLASLLLYDLIKKDPVIFSIGPLSGIFPCCSQSCAVFISPLSRDWAESYSGGWLAAAIRFSSLDAIVIIGRSREPLYLVIEDGKVAFRQARTLWGKGNYETYRILMEREGLPGKRSILTIGPAGEKKIAFASVNVDQFFSFQRLGLGAILGAKGVKGIVISGTQAEEINYPDLYRKVYQDILDRLMEETSLISLEQLHKQNEIGALPTQNLKAVKYSDLASISDEVFKDKFPQKNVASFGCPIATVHLLKHADNWLPYSFESIASLGPVLAIKDGRGVLSLLVKALDLGLDPVSLGVCLAYLSELKNLGSLKSEDYSSLIDSLLSGKESWARYLRLGVKVASQRMGGEDYALQLAGVEMAPYFNGYATILGQLIGMSHTIYDNDAHKIDLEILGETFDEKMLIFTIINNEKRNIILNSLIVDHFVREIYADPSLIFSALHAIGFSWSHEKLEKTSQELYYLKLKIKKALGWDLDQIKLPQRLFSIPSAYGILKKEKIRSMLNHYREGVLYK